MGTKPSHGHLPINGLSLYYEVYGELGTSKTSVAVDSRRVHGHRLDEVVGGGLRTTSAR